MPFYIGEDNDTSSNQHVEGREHMIYNKNRYTSTMQTRDIKQKEK